MALLAVACVSREQPTPASNAATFRPGTYALQLCRVLCDAEHPQNVIKSGWIVLDSIPIDLRPFTDSIRRALEDGAMMGAADSAAANGCFYLREDRRDLPTLGGALGGGLLYWAFARSSDSITFALYRSPDAGYRVTLAPGAVGLRGRGDSWGDDMPKPGYPDDVVAAQYVGPPDQGRCRDAGLAFLAQMREFGRELAAEPPLRKRPPNER